MSDRCCSNCNRIFSYPHELKKHLKNSFHCKKTQDEINEYFNKLKEEKTIVSTNNNCNFCKKSLSSKSTLTRHMKTCKEKIQNDDNYKIIERIIKTDLKDLPMDKLVKVVFYFNK